MAVSIVDSNSALAVAKDVTMSITLSGVNRAVLVSAVAAGGAGRTGTGARVNGVSMTKLGEAAFAGGSTTRMEFYLIKEAELPVNGTYDVNATWWATDSTQSATAIAFQDVDQVATITPDYNSVNGTPVAAGFTVEDGDIAAVFAYTSKNLAFSAITGYTKDEQIQNASPAHSHAIFTKAITADGTESVDATTGESGVYLSIGVAMPVAVAAPVATLTLPTETNIGDNKATLACTTDIAGGVLHSYVSTSATAPSVTDLVAGTGAVFKSTDVSAPTSFLTLGEVLADADNGDTGIGAPQSVIRVGDFYLFSWSDYIYTFDTSWVYQSRVYLRSVNGGLHIQTNGLFWDGTDLWATALEGSSPFRGWLFKLAISGTGVVTFVNATELSAGGESESPRIGPDGNWWISSHDKHGLDCYDSSLTFIAYYPFPVETDPGTSRWQQVIWIGDYAMVNVHNENANAPRTDVYYFDGTSFSAHNIALVPPTATCGQGLDFDGDDLIWCDRKTLTHGAVHKTTVVKLPIIGVNRFFPDTLASGTTYYTYFMQDTGSGETVYSDILESGAWSTTGAAGVTLEPPTASLALTGYTPTVTAGDAQTVTPQTAALSITGYAPEIVIGDAKVVGPSAAALTVTGYAPSVVAGDAKTVEPITGTLTLIGYAPTVIAGNSQVVEPANDALFITGYAPDVVIGDAQTVTPATGSLTITTYAPSVIAINPITITPQAGVITLTRYVPSVTTESTTKPPTPASRTYKVPAESRTYNVAA